MKRAFDSVKEMVFDDGVILYKHTYRTHQQSSDAAPAEKRKRTLGTQFKTHKGDEDPQTSCISHEQKVKHEVCQVTYILIKHELMLKTTHCCGGRCEVNSILS
jgi:hypothetical protein